MKIYFYLFRCKCFSKMNFREKLLKQLTKIENNLKLFAWDNSEQKNNQIFHKMNNLFVSIFISWRNLMFYRISLYSYCNSCVILVFKIYKFINKVKFIISMISNNNLFPNYFHSFLLMDKLWKIKIIKFILTDAKNHMI
jgi:hypothetical protein